MPKYIEVLKNVVTVFDFRNRDVIREEGGLTVLCDYFWDTKDSPFVHIIAQALSVLSSNNLENLQVMAEQQMLDCVEMYV